MKAESNVQPGVPFEINELPGGMAEVLFYENVEEIPDEEVERFAFDLYCMVTPFRENLEADIESHYEQWINHARAAETVGDSPPTPEQRLSALEQENEVLRQKNTELENLVNIILGGADSGQGV